MIPSGRWTFDAEVAACFDDMLHRSIPEHDEMRRLCFLVGRGFVQHQTPILDLGTSCGGALAHYIQQFGAWNRYVGIECSPPMAQAARERFQGLIDARLVEIREDDLRLTFPPVRPSLTLAVLTLQFLPIERRQRLLREIHRHTLPGGALILVEKVLGSTADLDELLVERHHDLKRSHGYSDAQVEAKRRALEGVLVPLTARWNEEALRSAGFTQIDCFWRNLNFAGWVAVRD